jgi:hypothetical protein
VNYLSDNGMSNLSGDKYFGCLLHRSTDDGSDELLFHCIKVARTETDKELPFTLQDRFDVER